MTTQTQPERIDAAEVWRAIGRLEGQAGVLIEGQRELRETQREIMEEIREVKMWMIRVFYAIIGIGGAIIVLLIATLIAALQR